MNRIEHKFNELKREGKKAFIAYITAGYPDLSVTRKLILGFSRIGVDIIELGVPFSDPMADGPIIQEAFQSALEKGITLKKVLDLVKAVRKDTAVPICLMTYYNPIFCFGEAKFVKEASLCGVDGVIIPDLPPEEGKKLIRLAAKYNLDTIFFLSPTSTIERIKLVSSAAKGFIYYVSLTGVTGPRAKLPADLSAGVRRIKKYTDKPVCVGFGVSSTEQVAKLSKFSDGAIIGSAIISKIKENLHKKELVQIVVKFTATLNSHSDLCRR